MMVPRAVGSDDRGATAIEYALLGALIGLGLIGSLVTTKGSLNAIFGTASSQIGSGGAGSPASPSAGTQFAPFQTKTLVGPVTKSAAGTQVQWRWDYTDGSQVTFVTDSASTFAQRALMYDAATKSAYYYYTDPAGNPVAFQYEVRLNPNAIISESWSTGIGNLTTGTPTAEYHAIYNTSGNQVGSNQLTPDAAYLTLFNANAANFTYLKSLAQ